MISPNVPSTPQLMKEDMELHGVELLVQSQELL